MTDKEQDNSKQLHLELGIELTPPNIDIEEIDSDSQEQTQTNKKPTTLPAEVTESALQLAPNVLPAAVQTAAQSSISLRNVQNRLAEFLTNENYLGLIAGTNPEVLPQLLDSVTNAVAISDNLFIKTAQTAEKSTSVNKLLDYLTRQLDQQSTTAQTKSEASTNKYQDDSIEQIKKAIYRNLDKRRDETHRTSKDYIDADYTVKDE